MINVSPFSQRPPELRLHLINSFCLSAQQHLSPWHTHTGKGSINIRYDCSYMFSFLYRYSLLLHMCCWTTTISYEDNHRFLSWPHFCVLTQANSKSFTTPECQNISIYPRKTNKTPHVWKEKKVKRYICLTFTPSRVSVTVRGLKQWCHCQRERQGGWKTDRLSEGKTNRDLNHCNQSLHWTSFSALYLLLFTQRMNTEMPLTHFSLHLKVSHSVSGKAQSGMFA